MISTLKNGLQIITINDSDCKSESAGCIRNFQERIFPYKQVSYVSLKI